MAVRKVLWREGTPVATSLATCCTSIWNSEHRLVHKTLMDSAVEVIAQLGLQVSSREKFVTFLTQASAYRMTRLDDW